MSAKAINEASGKELLNKFLEGTAIKNRFASVKEDVNWTQLVQDNPWLKTEVMSSAQTPFCQFTVLSWPLPPKSIVITYRA